MQAKAKNTKVDFYTKALSWIFLLVALSGFLRFYGALHQQENLLILGLSRPMQRYLLLSGLIAGLANLVLAVLTRFKSKISPLVPALGVGANIFASWIERLCLWTSQNRGGNTVFVISTHVAWAVLLGLFLWQRKRRTLDEHRN